MLVCHLPQTCRIFETVGSYCSEIEEPDKPDKPCARKRAGCAGPKPCAARESSTELDAPKAPGAAAGKPETCDKCDGRHPTDQCPHFKGERDKHKDAWVHYGGKDPHSMGADSGNFVLTHADVVRQPGDGSCLFHSLNYCMSKCRGLNVARSAQDLRIEIATFLRRNPELEIAGDTLEQWVMWDSNSSASAYAGRMEARGWGGGIEMAICSRLKQVNIHVYERAGSGFKRISCFNCESAKATVHVLYQGRLHYDALQVR